MANANKRDDDNQQYESTNKPNKCLKYIEDSFRLLEQARAEAINNNRQADPSTVPSSFSVNN